MAVFFVRGSGPSIPFKQKRPLTHYANNPKETDDHLDALTLCVEQGLSVLGESVAQVTLHSLDTKYSLKERDILKKPDRFVEALQAMFGSGAATIEKLVIQSICSTVGLDPRSLNPPTLSRCMKQVEKVIKIKKQ